LASLAAVIFPKTVPKSLCSSDLLRPKIGFDLPHSRHSGSSAEIPSLHWPLVTGHYSLATRHSQRSTVFPPTSPSSPGLANAHRPLPTVVPKSGSFCCQISERNDLKSLSDNCLKPKEIGFDLALFRHFISSAENSLLHWPLTTDHSPLPAAFSPTSPSPPELPTAHCPHTTCRPTSGVRPCADPPPLAPAFQPTPNFQRSNEARFR
jgi:hypothetical protein